MIQSVKNLVQSTKNTASRVKHSVKKAVTINDPYLRQDAKNHLIISGVLGTGAALALLAVAAAKAAQDA